MDLGQVFLTIFSYTLIAPIYVLAVMRLTRLINSDTVLDRVRLIPAAKSHAARNLALAARHSGQLETAAVLERTSRRWATVLYFLECPWCVGMWICLATAWLPLHHHDSRFVQYIGVALAASHLIGVFSFAADTEEVAVEESPA